MQCKARRERERVLPSPALGLPVLGSEVLSELQPGGERTQLLTAGQWESEGWGGGGGGGGVVVQQPHTEIS